MTSSPQTILVTGGTGFLGQHVIQQLLPSMEQGNTLRMLARGPQPLLEDLGVEVVQGDLLDEEVLATAVKDVDVVYHLAGKVERDAKKAHLMYSLHVDGTRKLLDAIRKGATPKKIVVASTSGTVGISKSANFVANDDSPMVEQVAKGWPYYLSKIYAERLCQNYVERYDLPIVLMRPSLLLGPGDDRQSSTKDVVLFLQKKIPIIPEGGISFVDVRDTAKAFIKAAEVGKPGATYLLGAANIPLEDYFKRLEHISGTRGPRLRPPEKAVKFGAKLFEGALSALGKTPDLDAESIEMGNYHWNIDSSKAERELGFSPRPANDTIRDTIEWIRRYHADFSHNFDTSQRRQPPAEFVSKEMLDFAQTLREQ